jgi:LysM repeat protein
MHLRAPAQTAFLVSATYSGRSPLGSPTNQARSHRGHRLPVAAAPALFGVAAAFALASAPAFATAPAAQAATIHTAAPVAAHRSGHEVARLLSVTRPAAKRSSQRAVSYTVQSGDTLSAIAQRFYSDPDYWPVLYWANHNQIQYADDIQVGQVLTVPVKPATIPGAPTVLSPAPAPAPAPSAASSSAPAGDQTSAPAEAAQTAPSYAAAAQTAPAQSAPAQSAPAQSAPAQAASPQNTTVSTTGDSSFQACVIQAESGGNPQVMNSSGHYGLYQFSASTWAEYGGNPADFGNASVAEQNQVFDNAMAAGGESNWAPYDGC